jgi:hypothetical protein
MGRLFRRVVRTARGPRRVRRAPAVRGADGRQYRVVAVDENENNEFADPPRKWGRVGIMAGVWAAALALGGWAAPGIAASGNPENVDPRDEAATDAEGAALRYLRYGSNEDLERAESALCEDASPELSANDFDAIRQSYADELGGITDIDVKTGDPAPSSDGISIAGTVSYISQGNRRQEEFLLTVQEDDGTYCVSNAVSLEDEEPTDSESTGEAVDPEEVATVFMRSIVGERNPQAAAASQCSSYTGTTPEELDAAITDWGATEAFLSGIEPAESTETSITAFTVEVTLKRELEQQAFAFVVGVQGDCVASLSGGDGLL